MGSPKKPDSYEEVFDYVQRRLREEGFDVDSLVASVAPRREHAVMLDILARVHTMKVDGASRDEIASALKSWSELTDWAMAHTTATQ